MAIIYSYPVASAVEAGDLLVGTDITGKQTKNFSIESIVAAGIPAHISGTTDTVPLFTGSNTIGDSIITQDSGANGVSIGGDVENNRKLKVHGNSAVDGNLYLSGASSSYSIEVGQSRTTEGVALLDLTGEIIPDDYGLRMIRYGGENAESAIIHTGTSNLRIRTENAADTVFENTKVGIGTSSPQRELDVNGGIIVRGEALFDNNVRFEAGIIDPTGSAGLAGQVLASTGFENVEWIDTLGAQGLQSVLDTGNTWVSGDGTSELSIVEGTNYITGEIKFDNPSAAWGYNLNAEEGLSFTNGCLTTNSTYKPEDGFNILGDEIKLRYKETSPDQYVYIQEFFGNNLFDVASRKIWDNPGGQGIQTTFSSNQAGGTLHWQYQNDFAWSVNDNEEILRIRGDINGSGRVGIKTSNPQRELDVNGGVRVRGPLDLFQQNDNTFAGTNAGNYYNVIGNSNAAFGEDALATITTASRNTAVGFKALKENISGNNNTSVGNGALEKVTVGSLNTAVGDRALNLVVDGQGNTAIGQEALLNQTTGNYNVSVGRRSGENITTGFKNTFLGYNAGVGIITGQRNIYIGSEATTGQDTTNTIVIGDTESVLGSNTTTIGNSDTTQTLIHGSISFEQHNGNNVRNLISTTDTDPCAIEIGQTGTSLISAINLKPGDAGGHIDLYNANDVAARFKSSRLLIGDLLDVSKALDKTIDIQDNDPFIRLENSLARKLDFWVDPSSPTSYIATSGGNDRLNLSTGGSDRIHIANDGSIGIGTTSPGSILDIVEPTNKAEIKLRVLSDQDAAISFENPNRTFKVGYDESKDVFKIANSTFNSKNFTIAPDGNCGIGTDEPDRDLHISSSSASIELENTSQSDCFINFKNPGRTFKVGYDDSSDVWKVAKSTFGNNALTVNGDDGRVGLGTQTTDPSAILELDSDEQGFLMPRLTTTEINAISSPATGLAVYNTSINTICFYNGTSWQKITHANM